MLNSKVILVTGAQGFTGRYICEILRKQGNEVVGLANSAVQQKGIFSCDLRDEKKLNQVIAEVNPDYVVHLAGIAFVGAADDSAFYDVNVIGTTNLMKSLAQVNVQKILVASSANIYGNPAHGLPITESESPKPINHYAASKLAMEHMVRTWQDTLPIIITRPFNYTGPGQDPSFLVPKMVAHYAQKSELLELGNLDVSRDFTSVHDLVSAYVRLLESDVSGETVNICSGTAISLGQIAQWLAELSGHQLEIRTNPAFVRSNEIKVLLGDNSHLKQLIDWAPSQSLKEVLRLMLEQG